MWLGPLTYHVSPFPAVLFRTAAKRNARNEKEMKRCFFCGGRKSVPLPPMQQFRLSCRLLLRRRSPLLRWSSSRSWATPVNMGRYFNADAIFFPYEQLFELDRTRLLWTRTRSFQVSPERETSQPPSCTRSSVGSRCRAPCRTPR